LELIELLTKNLDVQEGQAKGGAGLLLKMAQEKLGDEDFSKVAEHIPGIDSMIKEAPGGGGIGGVLGGVASALGGGRGSSLGNLASLAGGFSELGLDAGMIGQFIPVILSFVQSKGGEEVGELLSGVLK
jgi:hypothetical protein